MVHNFAKPLSILRNASLHTAMNVNMFRSFAIGLAALLIFASGGCSEKQPSVPEAKLKGKLTIKGSNTVGEELAPHLVAAYKNVQPDVAVEIESKGTESGLQALFSK